MLRNGELRFRETPHGEKMNKLKAAVIGVGYLGRFHAEKYLNNPAVELVGLSDANLEQLKKVGTELKVTTFPDPQSLIGQVDAVTIAASTQAHFELGKLFLNSGIAVNLEKPLAATLSQARELVELAQRKKTLLCTGHIERFNPSLRHLKSLLKTPLHLDLIRHTGFRARGADVSVLHDLLIHDLDLIHWLTGSEVVSLKAAAVKVLQPTWDAVEVWMELANGAQAHLTASRVSSVPRRQVRVLQASEVITVDSSQGSLEVVSKTGKAEEPLKFQNLQVEKADALQAETDAFVNAAMGRAEPAVTGADGLRVLELIEKIESLVAAGPCP